MSGLSLPVGLTLLVSFLSDFLITGGSTLTAGMVGSQVVALPNKAVWLMAIVAGLVQAARRVQAMFDPSPTGTTVPPIKGGA